MVTSGTGLTAHYCPQETFAILSRNKGEKGRACKRSYLVPHVRWDTRSYWKIIGNLQISKALRYIERNRKFCRFAGFAVPESSRCLPLSGFHQFPSISFTCALKIQVPCRTLSVTPFTLRIVRGCLLKYPSKIGGGFDLLYLFIQKNHQRISIFL